MLTRVAIISNSVTPYRVQLHLRLVRECPDLEIWSLFTHEFSNAPWKLGAPEEIRPVFFGAGEESGAQGFGASPWREFQKAARIEEHMRRNGVQAVVLFGYNDWCLLHLTRWCRQRQIPCFLFGDSNPQCEAPAGIKMHVKRALLPIVLRQYSGAMYCGGMGATYFRSYGVPENRLFPFPYEPDYDRVANVSAEDQARARAEFGLPAGRRRIVYSGRLAPIKRVDLLISAFQTLAPQRPEWDLAIAGDGPDRQGLLAMVEPALRDRIHFLGFINEPERLAGVYGISDVLVLPSDCEPWGVVVTEAATRLALVCSSQVGAAYDLVEDGRNGRIFPAGDAAGLFDALHDVTSPANIERMKAASPQILAAWRQATNPVLGLRQALRSSGFQIPLH